MQITGQTDERGEGAWHTSKLRPDYRQEGLLYLLIIAELTSLPGEKPLGNGWVLGHGPAEGAIGRMVLSTYVFLLMSFPHSGAFLGSFKLILHEKRPKKHASSLLFRKNNLIIVLS